jgi:hypothetical protein
MKIAIRALTTLLLIAALLLSAEQALADRAPTPEERSRIEAVLRAQGFTRWGEIELDDGAWEVDDSRGSDGREYDLKLDRGTLAIMEREAD